MTHSVYLALGTNLGDRLGNLRAAINAFSPEIVVRAESSIYQTEPWGYAEQPAFLNMVVHAETDLSPLELLAHLKHLEPALGRTSTFRNGPRLIDLDILFYDDLILPSTGLRRERSHRPDVPSGDERSGQAPPLVIPHPRLHERAFVLVPLADVAAKLVHPLLGRSVSQLVETVDRRGVSLFSALSGTKSGIKNLHHR